MLKYAFLNIHKTSAKLMVLFTILDIRLQSDSEHLPENPFAKKAICQKTHLPVSLCAKKLIFQKTKMYQFSNLNIVYKHEL